MIGRRLGRVRWSPAVALAIMALGLASSATAQPRTWVVDWFGRGDFNDMPPAFAAAAPGDVIETRNPSGNIYSPVTTSKGVNVVATSGWTHGGAITVTDLPASQTLRIAGLDGVYALRLHRCAGAVHLDHIFQHGAISGHGVLEIVDCPFVTLNNCWFTDMTVRNSTVLMSDCSVEGWADPYPFGLVAYPALRMIDSDVTASECWFRGGTAYPNGPWPAIPGIEMQGGRLRLAGATEASVQGGHVRWFNPPRVILSPAIHSDGGVVVVDPDARIPQYDGPAFSGTSQLITEEIPFLSLVHIYPGEPLDCGPAPTWRCPILDGPPGASAWILVSLPAAPLATPFGDFWLHPPSTILVAGGTIGASGQLRGTIDLRGVLRPGDATTWQGAVLGPAGLQLTHPAVPVLGIY